MQQGTQQHAPFHTRGYMDHPQKPSMITGKSDRRSAGALEELEKLDTQRNLLEARISNSSEAPATRMARATRDERRSVLRCAEVVVATLSAAGGDLPALLASGGRGAARDSVLRFDAVIIDEAAQAIEPATLIPMHLLDPVKVSSPAMCLCWLSRDLLRGGHCAELGIPNLWFRLVCVRAGVEFHNVLCILLCCSCGRHRPNLSWQISFP